MNGGVRLSIVRRIEAVSRKRFKLIALATFMLLLILGLSGVGYGFAMKPGERTDVYSVRSNRHSQMSRGVFMFFSIAFTLVGACGAWTSLREK